MRCWHQDRLNNPAFKKLIFNYTAIYIATRNFDVSPRIVYVKQNRGKYNFKNFSLSEEADKTIS